MSADSWQRCPICHNRPDEYPNGIEHLYGKLPLAEFLELSEELNEHADVETVRLDYEVDINDDGTASFWLNAKCMACGTKWSARAVIEHE
jgi:hypothetical protein